MYDRNIEDRILTFRFNPRVLRDNLLFEDVETGSVWSQLAQEAVKGSLKGTALKVLPAVQTTWKHWKETHPHTLVLSPRMGLSERFYDYAPTWTGGEDLVRGLRPRELVLALDLGSVGKAYPFPELKKAGGKIEDEIEGRRIQITYDDESATAVATEENGQPLPAVTVYWKNWVQFHRQTRVYRAKKRSLRGTLEIIDLGRKIFRIRNEKRADSLTFITGQKTKLKGSRKVLGRNEISWADLSAGLTVEVKFIQGVREALEVKVIGGNQ